MQTSALYSNFSAGRAKGGNVQAMSSSLRSFVHPFRALFVIKVFRNIARPETFMWATQRGKAESLKIYTN